jgi:flagellar export protein FliJ
MKSRDTMIQLVRFKAEEKRKKVADLETMIRDFESMAVDLDRQIEAEHERTGIHDVSHFAYSTFAKAAAQRRANLRASVADLKLKLEVARRDYEAAQDELKKAEMVEDREGDRRRSDGSAFSAGQGHRAHPRA